MTVLTADVDKLKCILFYAVRMLVESEWYGINCNLEPSKADIEKARLYLSLIKTGCPLPYSLVCEISAFVKKRYDYCVRMFNPCTTRLIVDASND